MGLIYASEYITLLNNLNSARAKFSLSAYSNADFIQYQKINAQNHNNLCSYITTTRDQIANKGFSVSSISVPTVKAGTLISKNTYNTLSNSITTLKDTCINYGNYGDCGDYGDYGDRINDSNCGDLVSAGYESGSPDDNPDCWVNTSPRLLD